MKVRTKHAVVAVFLLCIGTLLATNIWLNKAANQKLSLVYSVSNSFQVEQDSISFVVPKINDMTLFNIVSNSLDISLQQENEDFFTFQIARLPSGYKDQFSIVVNLKEQASNATYYLKKDFEDTSDSRTGDLIAPLADEVEFRIFEGLRCDSQGDCLFPVIELQLRKTEGDQDSPSDDKSFTFLKTRNIGPESIQVTTVNPAVIGGIVDLQLQEIKMLSGVGE